MTNYFYSDSIISDIIILDRVESNHCINVLRKSKGDTIHVVDGKGNLYIGEIINANKNNHLVTDMLEYPGHHFMQTDGVNINQTAVNINSTELISNYLTIESLQDAAPDNMQVISMESDVRAEIKHAQIGIELWHYCLYLIIFLLMLEMLIANVQRKN